ncbi:hypothetical protein EET67_12875 [Pseudaminobacter arsenicus]|uniref:Flagellar assembly protein FliH/Type III secretion system HrpE domain-containing protein n=1 Tax=Borborobacter arsenicus TaxID=1851146 RepID=A0A432V5W9_9HYPH|nr:hypothetical protein [Pseudaminobacter arsenicus]RUM97538.1 hypothetical protein EET67_12875 [Pseudaminobacter arsenicus]
MAALALSDILQDFGKRPPSTGETAARTQPHAAAMATARPAPEPDVAAIIAVEVARAETALEQRLTEEHEAALAAERQRHAAEIEALLQRFGGETAALIDTGIVAMEERVAALATTGAARLISGVLTEDLHKRTLDSLAGSIRTAIADREAVRIRISGPQSLFSALAAALPDRAASFDYTEAPGFDLTVTIDGDIFETRLSEWSAALSEILS